MIGMGTPKMAGSVKPNSLLLQHEGETRARTKLIHNVIKVQLQVIGEEK